MDAQRLLCSDMTEPTRPSQTCSNAISPREPVMIPSAMTRALHNCGGTVHTDGSVNDASQTCTI